MGTKTAKKMAIGAGGAIAAAAVISVIVSSAVGQTTPLLEPRPEISDRVIGLTTGDVFAPLEESSPGLIDFENVQGRQVGVGIELRDQYEKTHGLSFGRGVSVHFCARVTDDVNASLCSYPQAASGQRVAAHDVRTGGSAMVMNFSRPVESIFMKINPTGGTLDEIFAVELTGSNVRGDPVVQETIRFNWRQDAFTWPTSVGFETDGAQITRVTVALRRVAQKNQAVRFLIDDLSLLYSPEQTASPMADAIAEQGDRTDLGAPEVIASTGAGRTDGAAPVYRPAQKVRFPIDWAQAEALLARQQSLGLAAFPVEASDQSDFDRAILPVLLPGAAEGAVGISVQRGGDSYSAVFDQGGYEYSVYGTRVFTIFGAQPVAPADSTIVFSGAEYGVTASFSLFGGGQYELTRYCDADDEACFDHGSLAARVDELMVTLGQAAEARP